jgi:phosphatidylserine/phosphatidylglycerophosphate/cardiolipin synthase-like enzyme
MPLKPKLTLKRWLLTVSALVLTVILTLTNSTALHGKLTTTSVIKIISGEVKALTATAPATALEEFGFSPEGSAKVLVLKFVASSTHTLDIMAYGFTSQDITDALINAAQRGVKIRLIVDAKANLSEDKTNASQRALTRLVKVGIPVRTISIYPIHHDKVMIADGLHLENGSFNFTASAQAHNSENVSVRWNNPQAAAIYTQHFLSRWEKGQIFIATH